MRSLTFPKAWGNFNPPPNLSLFALSMATHSELTTAGLTDRKGPARVNTRHRYQSYWMRNGFHPGTQHWPSQTFALHKEKINLHEPGRREEVKGGLGGREGGSVEGRVREREGRALQGEDNEEDKWQGECGVKVREVDDGVWEVGEEREDAGCRKGRTRRRGVLSHGRQLADGWWWEWEWGRKASFLGGERWGHREGIQGWLFHGRSTRTNLSSRLHLQK